MVTPTITKDNFILVDNQGQARRRDVVDSKGHRMPFVVQSIVEDGGTHWYVEFWHWITGQYSIESVQETQPPGISSPAAVANIFPPEFPLE